MFTNMAAVSLFCTLIKCIDLTTERERQLTTARAIQTTGLTNGKAANWSPEGAFRDQSLFKLEEGVEEKLFFVPNYFQTPTQ